MTAEDIKALPMAGKLQIMEAIWEDLRDRLDHSEPTPRLRNILDQHRARVRDGAAQLFDWDRVKSTIGRP